MGRVRAVAVLAGLGMAAYWAGEAADVRIPKTFGWTAALALGAEYVWLAFVMSFGAIAAAQFVWERHRQPGWWKRAVLIAAAASALIPVGIGVGHHSMVGIVAALAAVVGLWSGLGKHQGDKSPGMGNIVPAMLVSLCLQLGVAALVGERIAAAAALAAFGCWMFLWGRKRKGWVRTGREAERWPLGVRVAGSVAVSILLCALAVVRYSSSPARAATPGMAATTANPPKAEAPDDDGGRVGGGDWPGVVVYPEVERHAMLLPPLPNLRKDPFHGLKTPPKPLSIPFFGAYWYFRKPYTRPPKGSPVMRGTPEKLRFLTWDGQPIRMEARQNLSTFVELSGCSSIQVVVRNADRYYGTVSIRLILVDSVKLMEWDLGEQSVTSKPRPGLGGAEQSLEETLAYGLGGAGALSRFDEFRVIYRMENMRWGRSAKIGIQKFVLIPRTGLSGPA
ncbi:MAG: hypothetical protein ABI972_30955 [Acidobacteriota bacterium]